MASVGELFVSLGFDVDSKALDQFDQGIKNLSGNMLELLGVAGVTAYEINKFVTGAMSGAQGMQNLAQGTRLAVEELQKYASVTHYLNPNISTESAAATVSDLDKRLNLLRNFGTDTGLSSAFGRAGIAIGDKNSIQLLNELSEKVRSKALSPTLESGILQQLGIPKEFMNVLQATPEQFKSIADKIGLTANQLDTLSESSRKLSQALDRITTWIETKLVKVIDLVDDTKHGGQEKNHSVIKSLTNFENWMDKKVDAAGNWITGSHSDRQAVINNLSGSTSSSPDDLSDIVGGKRNNPGNVTDGKTVRQFSTLAEGYQATSNLLLRYQQKGWDTIDKIIEHWAPYKDASGRVINPATGSGNYQNYLANLLHVDRNAHLDFANNPTLLRAFIKDQSQFEHGAQGSKVSNNVTIYNRGEVRPETWAAYTVQQYQNTIMQINNPATV